MTLVPRVLLCLALAWFVAAPAWAANEEFVGTWVLDIEGSEMPQKPKSLKQVIEIEDGNVVVQREGVPPDGAPQREPGSVEFTYLTNGELHTVPGGPRGTRDVTAKWRGDKLLVRFEFSPRAGITVKASETWKIKNDQLEIKTSLNTPVGTRVLKMRFDRVE